jgi:hypothetical protein
MSIERDNYLTEYFGFCWHEWKWIPGGGNRCKNCDIDLYGKNNDTYTQRTPTPQPRDFSTWEGFGWLWDKCVKQEWWEELNPGDDDYIPIRFVNPDRFANEVYEFLKEVEK